MDEDQARSLISEELDRVAEEAAGRILDRMGKERQGDPPPRAGDGEDGEGRDLDNDGASPPPDTGGEISGRGSRYPSRFTGVAHSIVVKRFEAGDQALAKRVIGLHRALWNNDKATARALSEGTGSAGGFLVPEEFATDVIEKVGQMTPFANREFMRILPMSRDVMNVPTLATRPTVSRIAENASGDTGIDPAFGQLTLTANKFGRVLPMSDELLTDEAIGVVEFLRDLYAEILAEKRNDLVINGTGTNEPEGIRTNGLVNTDAAAMTNAGTQQDSLVDAYNTLPPLARQGGIWVTSPQGWAVIAKIRDSNNNPVIQRLGDEPWSRLFGHPVFVTQAVPENLGVGSDETEVIFTNSRRGYVFGDRAQLEVATDASGKYFEQFQVALRVSERYDGRVAQPADYHVRSTGWK